MFTNKQYIKLTYKVYCINIAKINCENFFTTLIRNMFEEYFKKLGFTKKESEIFKTLFLLGTKPASTIAKYL